MRVDIGVFTYGVAFVCVCRPLLVQLVVQGRMVNLVFLVAKVLPGCRGREEKRVLL